MQRYQKLADWDYICEAAASQSSEMDKIPIIGNGDIFSYTDYDSKVARDGISKTAMLARGALIKPWLPTEVSWISTWKLFVGSTNSGFGSLTHRLIDFRLRRDAIGISRLRNALKSSKLSSGMDLSTGAQTSKGLTILDGFCWNGCHSCIDMSPWVCLKSSPNK